MAPRITPASLAKAADVNRTWVTKAAELGLISPRSLDGEDVIVVRLLPLIIQLPWPGERRSRSESRDMEPWQALAVNTARDVAGDPRTCRDTILWIMQDEVRVTHTSGERAAFVVDALRNRPCYPVPLGEWLHELPLGFELRPATTRQLTQAVA